MTIVDFLIKKFFCLRKSLLNTELEIYPSFCDNSHWRPPRQIHLPKGKLAWDFSIGFQKIYLFTFFDQVIQSQTQKVHKGTQCKSSVLPCHLPPGSPAWRELRCPSFLCMFPKVFYANIGMSNIYILFGFFCFVFLKHLYWSIIALKWCVSFCFIIKWISYTYTYVPIFLPSCVSLPPSLSHPSRWSQSTELISLCYAAAPHWLFYIW